MSYFFVELFSLLYKNFLDCEKIPIFTNRFKQVIEELIKFVSKIISDEDNVISEFDFMLSEVLGK
jgi:hypothetical protein